MFSASSARLAIFSAAAALVAPGCSPRTGGPPSAVDASRMPRPFEMPATLRPIQAEITGAAHEAHSVPVDYQQPQPAAPIGPRIVAVSAPIGNASSSAVREPVAASTVTSVPSPPPSQRSQFNPIAMPEPSRPPEGVALPMLAAKPEFSTLPSRDAGVIVEPAAPYSSYAGRQPAAPQPQPTAAAPSVPPVANTPSHRDA